jgi:phage baseplate assembly protein W
MAIEDYRNASARSRDKDPDARIGLVLPIRGGQHGFFKSSSTLLEQTKTNLKNLLLTVKGERLAQPEFGSNIFNLLFENFEPGLEKKLEGSIKKTVAQWLPHVIIKTLIIDAQDDDNFVGISIGFSVTSDPSSTDSISLTLARGG